jgi:protein TonB
MLSAILAAHVLILLAVISLGRVVIGTASPAMLVELVLEPQAAKAALPAFVVPLPHLLKPEIVIPEPPRFETLAAVQGVDKPAPAPAPAPSISHVSGPAQQVVEPPRFDVAYLDNPAPAYPAFARRTREQGKVMLRVRVDASGQVAGIEIHKSSGSQRLDDAALAAVRLWRFVPARSGDQAIAGIALVPIDFRLEG